MYSLRHRLLLYYGWHQRKHGSLAPVASSQLSKRTMFVAGASRFAGAICSCLYYCQHVLARANARYGEGTSKYSRQP